MKLKDLLNESSARSIVQKMPKKSKVRKYMMMSSDGLTSSGAFPTRAGIWKKLNFYNDTSPGEWKYVALVNAETKEIIGVYPWNKSDKKYTYSDKLTQKLTGTKIK